MGNRSGASRRRERNATLWAGVVLWCALAVSARAADVGLQVSLGWDGRTMVAERYTPITATIDSGTEALNAVLIAEYVQDATQRVRVVQAFSTTPGRAVPVQMAACLAGHAQGLDVRVESADGRELARRAYRLYPDAARGELSLELVAPPTMVVGTLGDQPALSPLVFVLMAKALPREAEMLGRVQPIARGALPVLPAAYDSLDALVVRASDAQGIDPRARAVLRQWVLGGGRLVVIADGTADDWRMWVSDGPDATQIAARDLPPGGVPDTLVAAIRARLEPPPPRPEVKGDPLQEARRIARRAQQARQRDRAKRDTPGTPVPGPPSSPEPPNADGVPPPPGAAQPTPPEPPTSPAAYEPATEMPRRAFTLSPAARLAGWTAQFGPEGRADEGLLAVGPMGLGMVVLVGVQPSRVSAVVAAQPTHAAWGEVLGSVMNVPGDRPEDLSGASGASRRSADAIDGVLNRISDVPPVSVWVFAGIGASVVVLAMLVGPVDFFVLRSLGRLPRSWATFLLWVLLAGGAAYALPIVLRSGSTRVQRLSVLDVVSEPGRPALAWQSSATTLWADRPLNGWFDAADAGPNPSGTVSRAPGVWRGVSPLGDAGAGDSDASMALPVVQMGQRPGATVAAGGDEWGGLPVGGESDTSPLAQGLGQPRWTLRAFTDERRLNPDVRVLVDEADGSFKVVARGGGGGGGSAGAATMRHAALRTAAGWTALSVAAGSGAFTHTLERGEASEGPPAWVGVAAGPTSDKTAAMEIVFGVRTAVFSPQLAMDLHGAGDRQRAMEARIATGEWAMVVMELADVEADVVFRTAGGERIAAERRVIVRWLLPATSGGKAGQETGAGT